MKGIPMNIVILHGVLSREPEVRELPSGDHVATFDVTVRDDGLETEVVPISWLGASGRPRSTSSWPAPTSSSPAECAAAGSAPGEPRRAAPRSQATVVVPARQARKAAAGRRRRARRGRGVAVGLTRGGTLGCSICNQVCTPGRHAMADISALLGDEAESLLGHTAKAIPKEDLSLPGPDFIDRVFVDTDRNPTVLRNLGALLDHGRLGGTGYVSILPVDQGIEHSAAASFAPNPAYFDPINIVKLAIEGGCNAVATTFGVLGMASRRYAHQIPFIVKLNHNELLTYPNKFDQVMFGNVQQACDLGAAGVGATIYFGSEESTRQLQEVSEAFAEAHQLGMFTVLWCYLRNTAFKKDGVDYSRRRPTSPARPTTSASRSRPTSSSRSCPENNGGYNALELRQDVAARLQRADDRPPDRPLPLAGRELLHGPHRAHQLRRRVEGRGRPGRGGAHRGHQQAGGRHGPHQRAQGVPAAAWPTASSCSTRSRTSTSTRSITIA